MQYTHMLKSLLYTYRTGQLGPYIASVFGRFGTRPACIKSRQDLLPEDLVVACQPCQPSWRKDWPDVGSIGKVPTVPPASCPMAWVLDFQSSEVPWRLTRWRRSSTFAGRFARLDKALLCHTGIFIKKITGDAGSNRSERGLANHPMMQPTWRGNSPMVLVVIINSMCNFYFF